LDLLVCYFDVIVVVFAIVLHAIVFLTLQLLIDFFTLLFVTKFIVDDVLLTLSIDIDFIFIILVLLLSVIIHIHLLVHLINNMWLVFISFALIFFTFSLIFVFILLMHGHQLLLVHVLASHLLVVISRLVLIVNLHELVGVLLGLQHQELLLLSFI
jgi:hypothetical protein